jgi:hypothetical protein
LYDRDKTRLGEDHPSFLNILRIDLQNDIRVDKPASTNGDPFCPQATKRGFQGTVTVQSGGPYQDEHAFAEQGMCQVRKESKIV